MQLGQLMTGVSWTAAPQGAREWLEAWRRDLSGCLPAFLRKRLGGGENRLELVLGDAGGAELLQVRGAERRLLTVLGEPDRGALASAVARPGLPLVVVAREPDVLCRRVRFPVQVRDNLDRVLGYEMDRLTPFDPKAVFFAYRQLPTGMPGQIELELAVIRKSRIEPWVAAAGAGNPVRSVTWPGAWNGANLLPAVLRGRGDRAARYLGIAAWLVLATLLLAVVATPLVQKRQIVIALGERLSQVRAKAGKVLELREQLDREAASANQVVKQKQATFHVIELLRRLTELMPDDTWVSQMSVRDNKVELRGESGSATGMIELLSKEPAFRNAVFKSPVVGIRNTERERFHVELELVPGGEG